MRVTIPYKPRDLSVHERLEAARFSVVAAHRRYGKTVLAVNHTIKGALTCNKPRGSFAYVAPFRNQAKAVAWDYLKYYTSPIPGRTVNESELSIMLPNGARIRIYGADNPDSLRGLYFDGVVLDEVADMKPEVWGEIIQPALADREGWALFIGTPHGINLFSELYYRALERQQKGDPLWCAMSFPVTGTTSLPPAEVERLRAELSENAWRQEMLCDFTASSDDILIPLPDVLEAEARQLAWDDVGGMPVILGVDVARFGADSSVIVRRQGLKVDGPVVMRGLDNMQLADRVAAAIMENRPTPCSSTPGRGRASSTACASWATMSLRCLSAASRCRKVTLPTGVPRCGTACASGSSPAASCRMKGTTCPACGRSSRPPCTGTTPRAAWCWSPRTRSRSAWGLRRTSPTPWP